MWAPKLIPRLPMITSYKRPLLRTYGSQAIDTDTSPWNGATVKQASNESGINITEKALKQLKYIAERDNDPHQLLRVMVDSGGCHGFQNKMELTTTTDEDDFVFEKDGVRVVVDGVSLQYLRGSNVDFVEELIGSTFQVVDNPNAKHSCGCNISFDIDLDMITQN
ncbi:hypothetical protein [Absidia glauca]|uniref:Core domain-containing protein n=1 Tax=Absidia glauca TaxID=4829 RepID=A0A163J477_ABSGL|nr:hypothetical protein [Absidia glauca]